MFSPYGWNLSPTTSFRLHFLHPSLRHNFSQKYWPNLSHKVWTKIQLQILTKLQLQNLNQASADIGAYQSSPQSKISD